MPVIQTESKNVIYNTKKEEQILKRTDYENVVTLVLGLIDYTLQNHDSNKMYGFIDKNGKEHWATKKTMHEALINLVQIQEEVKEKSKEIKIESNDDTHIDDQLKDIKQKLLIIDHKISNKNSTQLDQIKYDISNVKQRVDSLVNNYRGNHTKVQDEKKFNELEKKVDNYNDNIKKEMRDLRDSIETQSNNINDCYKQVRSLPGQINLLSNKIDNIDITPVITEEETNNELEITNPDAKLLAEMYEMSQKLNEMIYQVAVSMATNTEKMTDEKEDNE